MLIVRGEIANATQAPVVTAQILAQLAAVKALLPTSCHIGTTGAAEGSAKGQSSLNAEMPLMVLVMPSLLMVQLQSFSRVLMVLLTAPPGADRRRRRPATGNRAHLRPPGTFRI